MGIKHSEHQRQYEILVEGMAQGVVTQLADSTLVDANPAALEMLGLDREQFVGRTFFSPDWKVINEDGTDLPPEQHPSMVALRTGLPVREAVMGVYNPKRESFVWLIANAIPSFRQGEIKPYQVFVTFQDITQRKATEDKIRDREELFRALFEQAKGYVMLLHPTSSGIPTILDVNNAACEVHGYTREEMIGKPVILLDDKEGKRICRERTKQIITEGELKIETDHVRKDGSTFPVEVHASYVQFTNKPPVILTIEHDITERKKSELDLLNAKKELRLRNKSLEETNIALKVLIEQQEKNKERLEKNVLFNVEKLLMPTLRRLKNKASDHNLKKSLDILESNLNHIISPFLPRLTNHISKLTPAQIQVANLIKQGMTTKEIASHLNLSPATIAVQRQNIRKRLEVCPETSLRTFLLTNE